MTVALAIPETRPRDSLLLAATLKIGGQPGLVQNRWAYFAANCTT